MKNYGGAFGRERVVVRGHDEPAVAAVPVTLPKDPERRPCPARRDLAGRATGMRRRVQLLAFAELNAHAAAREPGHMGRAHPDRLTERAHRLPPFASRTARPRRIDSARSSTNHVWLTIRFGAYPHGSTSSGKSTRLIRAGIEMIVSG